MPGWNRGSIVYICAWLIEVAGEYYGNTVPNNDLNLDHSEFSHLTPTLPPRDRAVR